MKKKLIFVMLVLTMACSKPDLTLPPGYELMCSTSGKKYTLMLPGLIDPNRKILDANVFNTKQKAVAYAYKWEEIRRLPLIYESDKYEWEECD